MDNTIVPFTDFTDHTLGNPGSIGKILNYPEVLLAIGSRFPSPYPDRGLNNDEKIERANILVRDASIHIANSKARDQLARCTGGSFVDSLQSIASYDFSLDNAAGEAFLVPFLQKCTMMGGYKGYIKLLYNSGIISAIQTAVVYQGEKEGFEAFGGSNPRITHKLRMDIPRDDEHIYCVYALFTHQDGTVVWEIMNLQEIDKVAKCSRVKDGPWQWWKVPMARKSLICRAHKWLPKSSTNKFLQQFRRLEAEDSKMMDMDFKFTQKLIEAQSKETVEQANKGIDMPQPEGSVLPATPEKEHET